MASDRNNPWNTKTHPSPVLFLAKHCFPLLLFTPCKARVSAMHQKTMLPVISLMVHDVACGVKTRIQIRARCSLYPFFDIAPVCSNKKIMVKHMAWAIHGQTLDDRSRQVCATKPQAVFKTVSATLKLFPLTNLWCGSNRASCWMQCCISLSICMSVQLAPCLAGSCGLASSPLYWMAGFGSASSGWTFGLILGCRLAF